MPGGVARYPITTLAGWGGTDCCRQWGGWRHWYLSTKIGAKLVPAWCLMSAEGALMVILHYQNRHLIKIFGA